MTNNAFEEIAKSLLKNKTLTVLNLNGTVNRFYEKDNARHSEIIPIAKALQKNKALLVLDLGNR